MNILLIGNGFDLAHHLPTKYTDFLEFIKVIKQILKINNGEDVGDIDWGNTNVQVQELMKANLGNVRNNLFSQGDMWNDLVGDNVWIEYFLQCNNFLKENWIDFESEISRVIKIIDDDMNKYGGMSAIVRNISESFFETYLLDNLDERIQMRDMEAFDKYAGLPVGEQSKYIEQYRKDNPVLTLKEEITYNNLILRLEDDLNKLIRALEIYICEYVEKIEIEEKSSDIDELEIDFILSFNYTHVFSKLYNVSSASKKEIDDPFDYIHGEADSNNTVETNNMVLGIDEYLPDDRKNKDVEFIAFKKFYQRIYKGTGCKYKEWVNQIQNKHIGYLENEKQCTYMMMCARQIGDYGKASQWNQARSNTIEENKMDNLYIFGHSLDITDKDVLCDLILNDNVHTTIFYPDKKELGRKIANLVTVIGQDELIKRTGGSTKTIKFKPQKPMKENP